MSSVTTVFWISVDSHLVQWLQEDGAMLIHVQHTDVGLQFRDGIHRVCENGCSAWTTSNMECSTSTPLHPQHLRGCCLQDFRLDSKREIFKLTRGHMCVCVHIQASIVDDLTCMLTSGRRRMYSLLVQEAVVVFLHLLFANIRHVSVKV